MQLIFSVRGKLIRANATMSDILNKHRKLRIAIDILLILMFMLAVNYKLGFWMNNNDDSNLARIMAGQLTESTCPYAVFSNVIWGGMVSFCYSIIPGLPWYGLIQLIFVFSMLLLPLIAIEQRCDNALMYGLTILVGMISVLRILKLISQVQFTSLSILMAIAGYLCLTFYEKRWVKYITFIYFELFAYLLRGSAMEMIQPIGYAFFVVASLTVVIIKRGFRFNIREMIVKILPPFLCVVAIVGICKYVDDRAYQVPEWKNNQTVSKFRGYVTDVYPAPEYVEIKDILDKYDISEVEYNVCLNAKIIDVDRYAEALAEINTYMETVNYGIGENIPIQDTVKWVIIDSYSGHTDIILLTILCLIAVLLMGRFELYIPLFFYYIGKLIPWGYIYMRQRMVDRVIDPLYFSEYIYLISFLFIVLRYARPKVVKVQIFTYSVVGVLLLAVSLASVKTAKQDYSYCRKSLYTYNMLHSAAQSIEEYCNNNSDKKYIVSSELMTYWKYPLLSITNASQDNFVVLGGWFCPMPGSQERINNYLEDGSIHLLVAAEPAFQKANTELLDYLTLCFQTEPEYLGEFYNDLGDYAGEYVIR